MQVKAIVPKTKLNPKGIQPAIDQALGGFAKEVIGEMQRYPPEREWKTRPPSSGPRAGGRRTGELKHGWQAEFSSTSVHVYNDSPHAAYVQGKKQTRSAKERGWKAL